MCLFLFTNCSCKECAACLKGCVAGCPNPLMAFFNLLIGIPCAAILIIIGGLAPALARWPEGSWRSIKSLWEHVCFTLKRGKQAYDGAPARTNTSCDCCHAIFAEVYCCLLPAFVLITPALPIWLLVLMLTDIICGVVSGACTGCVDRVSDWWPKTARALRMLDDSIARTAGLGAGTPPFWSCLEDEAARLPHHVQPSNNQGGCAPTGVIDGRPPINQAYNQPYGGYAAPPPPVAVPVAPVAVPRPHGGQPLPQAQQAPQRTQAQQNAELAGAAANLAVGAAASVARAGMNALFTGGGQQRPQQQATHPQVPVANAALPRAQARPVGVPVGRPVG